MKFLVEYFYGCKIITRKQILTKNLYETFFNPNIFLVAKTFPRNRFLPKAFVKNILVGNIVWLQKHILLKCLRQIFPLKYI